MKREKQTLKIINNNLIIASQNLEKLNNNYYKKKISSVTNLCIKALKEKKKIIFCGNGGSAADSQHLCAELVSKFLKNRKPLPSIALTTNTSTLTSIANDFDYKYIFSKQLEALGNKGDVLIAIQQVEKVKILLKHLKFQKRKN